MAQKSVMAVGENFLARKVHKSTQTYHNEWIVFQEALSNSLDAIYKSGRDDGKVEIILDLNQDSVVVKDNGTGLPHDPELLLYGGSDKDEDDPNFKKYGGSQGVGLKVIYFCSEYFSLSSVIKGKKWTAKIENAYNFRNDTIYVNYDDKPTDTDEGDGTIVEYKFPIVDKPGRIHKFLVDLYSDYYNKIDDCLLFKDNWLQLALKHYLKTKTYAANTNTLLGINDVKKCDISIKIKYDLENYTFKNDLPNGLIEILEESGNSVVVNVENKYWDIKEAIKLTKPGVPRPTIIDEEIQPSGRGNKHNTSYIWFQKLVDEEGYKKLLTADHELREPVDLEKYQRLLFPYINGIYIVIGSVDEERLPRYLIGPAERFVSAKGIPTDHAIQNPTGVGELGYVPYIHFIVDVPEELNEGKRTISNTRLIGLINEFFRDAYRVTLRTIVTRITGRKIRQKKKVKRRQPPSRYIVDLPNIPLDELSIKKIPDDEETVIALFYELIGRGYLKGYKTYANYRNGQYDAKGILISPAEPDEPEIERDSDLHIFEFKKKLSGIIDNFESEDKDPEEIDLLICWEDDIEELDNENYQMIHIEHSVHSSNPYYGVTKCLRVNEVPAEIQVLVLSELIEKIRKEKSQ